MSTYTGEEGHSRLFLLPDFGFYDIYTYWRSRNGLPPLDSLWRQAARGPASGFTPKEAHAIANAYNSQVVNSYFIALTVSLPLMYLMKKRLKATTCRLEQFGMIAPPLSIPFFYLHLRQPSSEYERIAKANGDHPTAFGQYLLDRLHPSQGKAPVAEKAHGHAHEEKAKAEPKFKAEGDHKKKH